MKKEKLYTGDGENLRGYKIGNYYLLKHYTWGNKYEWLVSIENNTYMECEIMEALENKKCFFVDSFKDGLEKIEKLDKMQNI